MYSPSPELATRSEDDVDGVGASSVLSSSSFAEHSRGKDAPLKAVAMLSGEAASDVGVGGDGDVETGGGGGGNGFFLVVASSFLLSTSAMTRQAPVSATSCSSCDVRDRCWTAMPAVSASRKSWETRCSSSWQGEYGMAQ